MQDGADQPREEGEGEVPAGDLGRPRREPDPLTIGLVVFFVALIAIVGLLLVAPIVTR